MKNTLAVVSQWSCLALVWLLPAVGSAQELKFGDEGSEPAIRLSVRRPAEPISSQEVPPTAESPVLEKDSSKEALGPIQTRELSTEIRVVSTDISGVGMSLKPEGETSAAMATELMLPDGTARGATFKQVNWKPSMVFHHPLYFEEAMLERHGHDRFGLLQPLASGARFYTSIALYPYLQSLRKPSECVYALGNRRPGTCVPKLQDSLPWDKRAAATQLIATGGLFWAAPL